VDKTILGAHVCSQVLSSTYGSLRSGTPANQATNRDCPMQNQHIFSDDKEATDILPASFTPEER